MLCYKLFFGQAINKLIKTLPSSQDNPSDASFLLETETLTQFG